MPFYRFHLFRTKGAVSSITALELATDGDTFAQANQLLDGHNLGAWVDVWQGARAVTALHREQPLIRPVDGPPRRTLHLKPVSAP